MSKKVYCLGENTGCDHEDKPTLVKCTDCPYMTTIKPMSEQDKWEEQIKAIVADFGAEVISQPQKNYPELTNGATKEILAKVKQHDEQQEEAKWISVSDRLPTGQWNVNHPWLSEEVLVANTCAICVGFYNRNNETWYVDEPAKEEWIDKIRYWMPLPVNPC